MKLGFVELVWHNIPWPMDKATQNSTRFLSHCFLKSKESTLLNSSDHVSYGRLRVETHDVERWKETKDEKQMFYFEVKITVLPFLSWYCMHPSRRYCPATMNLHYSVSLDM